uniref:NADH-ubiquinone oxidoreductase chain 6 n=1 Tax=Coenomyia ferruginea TaxID=124306 RepID=A0A7L8XU78_9DIPT|nr:NADH dehydrogenase subunit 6 [Coenomyia ferruginea]QOI08133.1 NADH dehydrogenase subunit 6 [Coenomyia ferruginea]UDF83766.1 NADH dehydrogenase subunit 6 [Coenomyia ferruginea]
MIHIMLYLYTMISSLIFMQMNHPLAMGLMLLIQTLLICMITGMMTKTFWFSYILFLIFLGGMLVLFIYVTSLASNEMFSISMKLTFICLIIFSLLMMINLIMDKSILMNYMNNYEMMSVSYMESYMNENTTSLNKLYNYPTNMITILLVNYLLLTLIIIVKITNIFFGPLRPMN